MEGHWNKGTQQSLIKEVLRDEISRGVYPMGSKIPTEPELMSRFGVSRTTVTLAIKDLCAEGLLVRQQGKGTFVSGHPQLMADLGALLQRTTHRHMAGSHTVPDVALRLPPAEVAADLNLPNGEHTWVFSRQRLDENGALIIVEQAYIPQSLAPQPLTRHEEWKDRKFIQILAEVSQQRVTRCRAYLQVTALTKEIASIMQVPTGRHTIEIARVYTANNQPVLLTRSILRPGATRYYVDLDLTAIEG